MGCDIHLMTEKQREDGTWEAVRKMPLDNFIQRKAQEDEQQGISVKDSYWRTRWLALSRAGGVLRWLYDSRNYNLFAILADVRNGYGFAGVSTGRGFNPISSPKGVPEDASPEYLEYVESMGVDGHSHSYHTLKDLLDYNWHQTTTHYGVISEEQYKDWTPGTEPDLYCGAIYSQNVIMVSQEEMDDVIKGNLAKDNTKEYYTKVSWASTYKESVNFFYDNCIEALKELSEDDEGEDVRIVFFFDN